MLVTPHILDSMLQDSSDEIQSHEAASELRNRSHGYQIFPGSKIKKNQSADAVASKVRAFYVGQNARCLEKRETTDSGINSGGF